MPLLKSSDKGKSKSIGSHLDKISSGSGSSSGGDGRSKFNLRFEKVGKNDGGGNTSKKLKSVTSNFKCLFYKKKTRGGSDGRSATDDSSSNKSNSPTTGSSSPSRDESRSPEVLRAGKAIGNVDLAVRDSANVPIPAERRSRTNSVSSNGTLDRPVPVPRMGVRQAMSPSQGRIPSQQVIYDEHASLQNFHMQSLGTTSPQGHLLFRAPNNPNFRRPPPRSLPTNPPLPPPRNASETYPGVVYAPRVYGPMVAYVRGPFPPSSRHLPPPPPGHMLVRGPPPMRARLLPPPPPPPHLLGFRGNDAFIMRCPPPPGVLIRSPHDHLNNQLYRSEPSLHSLVPPSPDYSSLSAHDDDDKYSVSVQMTKDGSIMQLPFVPPRNQSLSPDMYDKEVSMIAARHQDKLQEKLRTISRLQLLQNSEILEENHVDDDDGPRQIRDIDPSINKIYVKRGESSKRENRNRSTIERKTRNEMIYHHGGGDNQSSLYPAVLIDHKLPRVPHPAMDYHQRQYVIQNMRKLGNRKASLHSLHENGYGYCTNNRKGMMMMRNGSVSCSDLRRISESKSNKKGVPWFRWFTSRGSDAGDKGKEHRDNSLKKTASNGSAVINNNNNSVRSDLLDTNPNCVWCNKVLPKPGGILSVNQPVECSICSLRVCRGCAVWNQSKNTLTCGHCHPPTSIDRKANFWLEGVSHGDASFVTAERDKTTEEVRQHLEQLVDSYIDEGIASVSLARLFDNPQYDVLFQRFHDKLSDALTNLGYSLKLAIENKPMNETPTSAHTTLTNLLSEVKETAMELPVMEATAIQAKMMSTDKLKDDLSTATDSAAVNVKKDEGTQASYEDVLATAILNRVVLNGQKSRNKSDSPMSLVDSAVQTDSEMSESGEIVAQKNQYNVQGWVTNLEKRSPQQHSNLSDDDLSMGTSSSNWSNEGAAVKGNTHQQIVIEEQVEEITTTYESDSDIGRSPPVRNRKMRKSGRRSNNNASYVPATTVKNDDPLFGVDISNFDKRVPFPEGGVDIIAPHEADEDDEEQDPKASALLVSQISEWEQNWLFKRRKQIFKKRNLMAEAVPMLVPNPNEDGVEPQVGTEKASDLSDLSDHANDDDDDDFMSSSDEEEQLDLNESKRDVNGSTGVKINEAISPNLELFTPLQSHASPAPVPKSQEVLLRAEAPLPIERRSSNGSLRSDTSSIRSGSIPKKPERKVVQGVTLLEIPQDCTSPAGKTAKFACVVADSSPSYSVAWFFDGVLITSEKGKRWIYSAENTHQHYLYIYDINEKDSGNYHISVFDHRGNETKHGFKLVVTDSEQRKTEPPTFTVLKEVIKTSQDEPIVQIPFEISGFPEPYLEVYRNNIDISKLSHALLEDKGSGKWMLQLRKADTEYSIDGEYVAVAKNKGGLTKHTFQIQASGESPKMVKKPTAFAEPQKMNKASSNLAAAPRENNAKSLSPQPRSISATSEVSSIEETLRDMSQSMDRNQTLFKEDYEDLLEWERRNIDASKMTIAEREKLKWQNPVNLPNNPYAPENLAKRIRQRENSGFSMPASKSGDIGVTSSSSDDEIPTSMDRIAQTYQKFSRDYYVHGVKPSPAKLPLGPKFPPSSASNQSSDKEEEMPKESIVERKSPSLLPLNRNPLITPDSKKEAIPALIKVPSSASEYFEPNVKEIIQEAEKKNDPVVPESVQFKKAPSSSPRSSPIRDISSTSPTPSPIRSRQVSIDSRASSRRDSVELEAIKLPSVKQLAQQFNKEKTPVEDVKHKDNPIKSSPLQNHIAKNLSKEPKSIQQPKPVNVMQAQDHTDYPTPVPRQSTRSQPRPRKDSILLRQESLQLQSPTLLSPVTDDDKQISEHFNSPFPPSETFNPYYVDEPITPKTPGPSENEFEASFTIEELENDEDGTTTPPPLPNSLPPLKSPDIEQPILALFDPLTFDNQTESLDSSHDAPTSTNPFVYDDDSSFLAENSEYILPPVPDDYMPRWSRSKSETDSLDIDLLQFELKPGEKDYPHPVLPDTPQPTSLTTTITDDSEGSITETEIESGLDAQLDNLRKTDLISLDVDKLIDIESDVPSATTSKRNSWNTTSSFVYDQNENRISPFDYENKRDYEDDDNNSWTEDSSSISRFDNILSASEVKDNDDSKASDPAPPTKTPKRSPSLVKNLAAMFEAKSSPTASRSNSSVGKRSISSNSSSRNMSPALSRENLAFDQNSLGRYSGVSSPTLSTRSNSSLNTNSRSSSVNNSPMTPNRRWPLTSTPSIERKPTAMEILATPSPSLLAKQRSREMGEDEELNLKRLRNSIVHGARAAVGLKGSKEVEGTENEADPSPIKRSTSMAPLEIMTSEERDMQQRAKKDRPQSLVMEQDLETTF